MRTCFRAGGESSCSLWRWIGSAVYRAFSRSPTRPSAIAAWISAPFGASEAEAAGFESAGRTGSRPPQAPSSIANARRQPTMKSFPRNLDSCTKIAHSDFVMLRRAETAIKRHTESPSPRA